MIIFADVHLGRENDSIMLPEGPSQTVDIMRRLGWVLGETVMRGQKVIAVAGDIFNKLNPKSSDISIWFSWLAQCRRMNIKVYLIPGNHDAGVDWMNMVMVQNAELPNVKVFTAPGVELIDDGVHTAEVLFWPHIPQARRETIEKDQTVSEYVAGMFPEVELVITHGQVTRSDYMNDIFFEAGDSMPIESAPFKKLKRMVAGHIHKHVTYGKIVYPGSLIINNFGEVDEEKGYIDLDLSTGKVEWVSYPEEGVVPWVHVDLDLTERDETSLDAAAVAEIATGAVVKIVVLAKRHGVIDETYIRTLFNKYGRVTRFETRIQDGEAEVVHRKRVSHRELLRDFLKDHETATDKEKRSALVIGSKIIEEVTS